MEDHMINPPDETRQWPLVTCPRCGEDGKDCQCDGDEEDGIRECQGYAEDDACEPMTPEEIAAQECPF